MHALDSSELVPEPQGSEAASDESDKIKKDPGDSPAIAQDSTSMEPLEGKLLGMLLVLRMKYRSNTGPNG
jgi:hypothetical protein